MEALHIAGTAKKFRGAAEQRRWYSLLSPFGAQHVLDMRYDLGSLDGAEKEPESSYHLTMS